MPSEQCFIFTGENSFLLHEKITRWKNSFIAKHGQENLVSVIGSDVSFQSLLDDVATMPFLSAKRLVMCDGIPSCTKQEAAALIDAMHPDVILVFIDESPDKRLSGTKEFLQRATVKLCKPLTRAQLTVWMKTTAKQWGAALTNEGAERIMGIVGDDQWMLFSEIQKLALATAGDRNITDSLIDQLSIPSGSQVVWRLTDLVGAGKRNEAIVFLEQRLDRSDQPYDLWIALLTMVRNVAAAWAASKQSGPSTADIASQADVNAYALRSLMPMVRSLNRSNVRGLVAMAVEYEINIKSGKMKYTAESPDELVLAMHRIILGCSLYGEKSRSGATSTR